MVEPYIAVHGLGYQYPDGTQALTSVDLQIGANEMVAFIGQNGSGKTTLSKCLNGLLRPTVGRVTVDNLDTRSRGIVKKMATRVGYVFQNPDHQIFNNTVYKEVAYGPRNLGIDEEETRERVDEAAGVAGIGAELYEQHPFFLTKGLRQRVAIASILALRPKVMIVDEPTTGQDYRQSLEIMNFLKRLWAEEGHSIVVVTHEVNLVAAYCPRTVLLGGGRILADGATSKVLTDHDLLAQSDVVPPQVTRLALRLREFGIRQDLLSIQELHDELVQRVLSDRERRRASGC